MIDSFRQRRERMIQLKARREGKESDVPRKHIAKAVFGKCPDCGAMVPKTELARTLYVCPKCGYHHPVGAYLRLSMLLDSKSFRELDEKLSAPNALKFPGYDDKLQAARKSTGLTEGVVTARGKIDGRMAVFAVMDSRFIMGSMGHVDGEKITKTFEYATEHGLPVVGFAHSGGARMHGGIISLLQMAETGAAVAKHSEAGLLYISVLTDPTTGGVSASFAFEADIIMAEKGALIGFAGPRVIEQTIRQKLPEGFQRAEFQQQKGFADLIVERKEMKEKLAQLLQLHCAEAKRHERIRNRFKEPREGQTHRGALYLRNRGEFYRTARRPPLCGRPRRHRRHRHDRRQTRHRHRH